MTLLTLITVNAVLAGAAVYGIVLLFGHSIRHEAKVVEQHLRSTLHRLPERSRDKLAA